MKPWIAYLLLVGFVSIAVFGASAMGRHQNGHSGCIAASANGTDCPAEETPLPAALFHLSTFFSFFTAVFGSVEGLTAVLLSFALILVAAYVLDRFKLKPALISERLRTTEELREPWSRIYSWLALFEKRDPALS